MNAAKKSVKKTVGHDALAVEVRYPTGGRVRFSIGRTGDRLAVAGASGAEGQRQMAVLADWTEARGGETHGQRIDRVHALMSQAESVGDLVRLVEAL